MVCLFLSYQCTIPYHIITARWYVCYCARVPVLTVKRRKIVYRPVVLRNNHSSRDRGWHTHDAHPAWLAPSHSQTQRDDRPDNIWPPGFQNDRVMNSMLRISRHKLLRFSFLLLLFQRTSTTNRFHTPYVIHVLFIRRATIIAVDVLLCNFAKFGGVQWLV